MSRALPMSKPTGPETVTISSGGGFWPNFRHVHRSEREDLEDVLRSHDRSPDEFYVSDTPTRIDRASFEKEGVYYGPRANEVIIRSRKTGVQRAYEAGPGRGEIPAWVKEFENDLKTGLFE